jgi:hypothetical protein
MTSSGSPKEFAMRLFSEEPQPPNSISTFFSTDGDDCAMFEILLIIFTEGLKLWYEPPITISNVKADDFLKLQSYFQSFGYNIFLNVSDVNPYTRIDNKSYTKQNELQNMKFQMSENAVLYTITFSKLN